MIAERQRGERQSGERLIGETERRKIGKKGEGERERQKGETVRRLRKEGGM
jgi:hypothetical protein